jgi:hypothetical protein
MPARASYCCSASLPAVTALSWVGFSLQFVGAVWLWVAWTDYIKLLKQMQLGAGASFLGASFAFNFVAAVLYSVSTCSVVGSLPFIGRSPTNCCVVNLVNVAEPKPNAPAPALAIFVPSDKEKVMMPVAMTAVAV